MKSKFNRFEELLEFDLNFKREYKLIAGIDEAGRGAIAGPVYSAAVILDSNLPNFEFIDDSKTLTPKQRELALDYIKSHCISYSYAYLDNNIIDKINILKATIQSMEIAVRKLDPEPNFLLIDGNYYKSEIIPYKTVIEGDAKSLSIASASIIAKVHRDRFMIEEANELYPQYDFASNKGYGTRSHFEAVSKYGPSPIHRRSFLKKLFHKNKNSLF